MRGGAGVGGGGRVAWRRGSPIAGPKTISRPGRWSAIRFPAAGSEIIGSLQTYTIRKGDTLLDVARWYGLSPTEVSNANNHMDWWSPPVGKLIVIPTEHILPATPHAGIVMNIPEMRLYYYYPTPVGGRRRIGKAKFTHTAYAEPRHPKKHGKAKAHTDRRCASDGHLHFSGRPRPLRLAHADRRLDHPRQNSQSDLGSARRHLPGASGT